MDLRRSAQVASLSATTFSPEFLTDGGCIESLIGEKLVLSRPQSALYAQFTPKR
jgi:hypothetical protein